jgi:N-acetylated-alpha-linked acidic dipeptidase
MRLPSFLNPYPPTLIPPPRPTLFPPPSSPYLQTKGPAYPNGPWRPSSGVQRGSVQFNSLCAGDPSRAYLNRTSPDRSATAEACGYDEAELIPSIPVLPLSYSDARPLLASMRDSPLAPPHFQGGLPLPAKYRLGPSAHPARLFIRHREARATPIWNVIAHLPGRDAFRSPGRDVFGPSQDAFNYGRDAFSPAQDSSGPSEDASSPDRDASSPGDVFSSAGRPFLSPADRPIILGNHRDAWVFGAVDPNSGTAAMLELARGLGALRKGGWVPRRSIVLCSWCAGRLNNQRVHTHHPCPHFFPLREF